jgi:Leucine-rich repeat (LRR) protein
MNSFVTLTFVLALNVYLAKSLFIEDRDVNNSADLFRNSKTFGGLKNLKTLYLQNNKIQYVNPTVLDGITCLTSFNFDNNVCKITTQTVKFLIHLILEN